MPRIMTENVLRVIGDALLDSVFRMPYCSATPFYRYFTKESLDPRFGDICIWQLFKAVDRVHAETGLKFDFLRDTRHLIGVLELADAIVVIDPYLSHFTPLVFPRGTNYELQKSVSLGAPYVTTQDGVVHPGITEAILKPNERDYTIAITQYRYRVEDADYGVTRAFSAPSSAKVSRDLDGISVEPLLFHAEQTSLSVRIVEPRSLEYFEYRMPITDSVDHDCSNIETRVNSQPVSVKEIQRFDDAFMNQCWLTEAEIRSHLMAARRLYEDNRLKWV